MDKVIFGVDESPSYIEYISTDILDDKIYFKYYGDEVTVDVIVSWKGITKYKTKMTLHSNPTIIYFIGVKNFLNEVNDFTLEFYFKEYDIKIPIIINEKNSQTETSYSLLTNKDDSAYDTYSEIFKKNIYVGDKVKVEENDLVVDIGTNYGFFAIHAKNMGARKVICYEPSKKLMGALHHNLSSLNCIINQVGVSGESKSSKFKEDTISSASSCLSSDDGYDVETIGINRLIDSVGEKIDFLKIDCEGEEYEIFKKINLEQISNVKKIAVEYHSEMIKNFIHDKLISYGFFIEKIENSIIYAFNPKLFAKKKKVALISTFCDNDEKLGILKENILKIKKLGIDVISISPIPVPQEIVNLCDYFFYTKDNPLLKWPTRMYTHWYEMPISQNKFVTIQRGLADYGWAGLFQVKKLTQIALTFDYEIFYHLIYDLEIDEVVESELLSDKVNIIHPRRDPHHPETLWETTLHFMVFDKDMMEKIEKEITLENYLSTNGVAEGEVFKWKNKFNITGSEHPVKDKIFYWENYDFFNYSPFEDFKFFPSKNEKMTIWLGESPIYSSELTDNLRMVFYNYEKIEKVKLRINSIDYVLEPKSWELIEIDVPSLDVYEFIIEYKGQIFDFIENYNKIMMNQIYYNHRP